MGNFKKNLANNLTLIAVLICTLVHLVILTMNVFGLLSIELDEDFNYFFAYMLVIFSLCLYILGFFIEKITKLDIPSWFEIVFYIAFFIFTNTYYITGAYTNIFAVILMFAYISVIVTIVNISVFYHTQKDENNRLSGSRAYIVTSIFFYSVATNGIIELFVTALKSFLLPEFVLTTLNAFIVEYSAMILTSIVMAIMLNASLNKSKRFINACLIKKQSPAATTKNTKAASNSKGK